MKKYIIKITSASIIVAVILFSTVPTFTSSLNKPEQINEKIQQLEQLRLNCYVMSVYFSDLRYVSASYYEDPLEGQSDYINHLTGDELKQFIADKMESFALKDIRENFDKYDDDDLEPDELFFKYEVLPRLINLYAEYGKDGISMGTTQGFSIYNELIYLGDHDLMQSMLIPIFMVYYYNFAIDKIEFLLPLLREYKESGISSKDYNSLISSMEKTNEELIMEIYFEDHQNSSQIYKILYTNTGDWSFVDDPEGNLEKEIYDLLLNPGISSGALGLLGIISALGLTGILIVVGGVIFVTKNTKKKNISINTPVKPVEPKNVMPSKRINTNEDANTNKVIEPEIPAENNINSKVVDSKEKTDTNTQPSEKELYIKKLCEKYNTTPDRLKEVIQQKIKSARRDAKSWEKKATAMAVAENVSKLTTVTADAIVDGMGNVTGIPGIKIKAAYKVARSTTSTIAEKGLNSQNFIGGTISGTGNAFLDFVDNNAVKSTITVVSETVSGAVTDGLKGAKDGFISGSYDATVNYLMDKISGSSLREKIPGKSYINKKAINLVDKSNMKSFTNEYSKTVINTSSSIINEFAAKPALKIKNIIP